MHDPDFLAVCRDCRLTPDEVADPDEAAYVLAEREGLRLDSALCVECSDPGLCAAERFCGLACAPF